LVSPADYYPGYILSVKYEPGNNRMPMAGLYARVNQATASMAPVKPPSTMAWQKDSDFSALSTFS
jgi:hypothetical protein